MTVISGIFCICYNVTTIKKFIYVFQRHETMLSVKYEVQSIYHLFNGSCEICVCVKKNVCSVFSSRNNISNVINLILFTNVNYNILSEE